MVKIIDTFDKVHFLLARYDFAQLIDLPIADIQNFFAEFCDSVT